jgi:hypothetical protein
MRPCRRPSDDRSGTRLRCPAAGSEDARIAVAKWASHEGACSGNRMQACATCRRSRVMPTESSRAASCRACPKGSADGGKRPERVGRMVARVDRRSTARGGLVRCDTSLGLGRSPRRGGSVRGRAATVHDAGRRHARWEGLDAVSQLLSLLDGVSPGGGRFRGSALSTVRSAAGGAESPAAAGGGPRSRPARCAGAEDVRRRRRPAHVLRRQRVTQTGRSR